MGNAIWLLTALPSWYFSALLDPFAADALTVAPAIGALCLILGVSLGVVRREKRLLIFVIPTALSEVLVAIAGFFRGQVATAPSQYALLTFIAIQILLCGYLIYRLKEARFAASALSIFAISYSLFASFIATMAFSDNWV